MSCWLPQKLHPLCKPLSLVATRKCTNTTDWCRLLYNSQHCCGHFYPLHCNSQCCFAGILVREVLLFVQFHSMTSSALQGCCNIGMLKHVLLLIVQSFALNSVLLVIFSIHFDNCFSKLLTGDFSKKALYNGRKVISASGHVKNSLGHSSRIEVQKFQ